MERGRGRAFGTLLGVDLVPGWGLRKKLWELGRGAGDFGGVLGRLMIVKRDCVKRILAFAPGLRLGSVIGSSETLRIQLAMKENWWQFVLSPCQQLCLQRYDGWTYYREPSQYPPRTREQ